MGKAKIRPLKSKPLNGFLQNLALLIRSRKSAPNQIWWRSDQRGFWVNMWNVRCLLLALFFPNRPGGHTREYIGGEAAWPHLLPVFTENGLNDVVPRTDVPFAVKIETFSNSWTAKIWHFFGLRKFSLGFHLYICGLISIHPLFFIGAP